MFSSVRVLTLITLLTGSEVFAAETSDTDKGGESEEDRTVEIAIERVTDPKTARLDYVFALDVGYNSNVAGIPDQFDPEDSVTSGQSARVTYRMVGDQNTGLSLRGIVNIDQVASLHRFDSRNESVALNAYKTVNDKLRLTADASAAGFREDGEHIADVRTLSLEASWQHNPNHRSLLTYVRSSQELVSRTNDPDREIAEETEAGDSVPDDEDAQAGLIEQARLDFLQRQADRQNQLIEDELDPDAIVSTVQARHDINFELFGKRSVFIAAVSYSDVEAQGDSVDSRSTSGIGQFVYLLTSRLSLESTYSYRLADYDHAHVLTNFEEKRRDISRGYSLGLRWVQTPNLNYRVSVSHQNVDSSIPGIYTFDRTSANLSLEWRDQR